MNKRAVKVMIIVQIVLLLLVGYGIYKSRVQVDRLNYMTEKYVNLEMDLNYYKDILAYFYSYENKVETNYIGVNESGDSTSLDRLTTEFGDIKIFKYKTSDCTDCVKSALDKMLSIDNKSNFLIMSDFRSYANMHYLKKKHGNIMLLRVSRFETTDVTPCIYQIDDELKISNYLYISIIDKILPSYLNAVNKNETIKSNEILTL